MFLHQFFLAFVVLLSFTAQALFIESPCCSAFPHMGAQFGPRLQFFSPGVRGTVSRSKSPQDCSGAEEGTIVLVDRHEGHAFVDIVRACQQKQVVAVIVRNQQGGQDDLVRMGGRADDITVPAIFVSKRAGEKLDLDLLQENKVIVQLYEADDLGYLYGTLMFVFPFMLVVMLFSCVFMALVRISLHRICQRRCATRRRAVLVEQQVTTTLNEPLMVDSNNSDDNDVEQQEEKHFPIVLPNTTANTSNTNSMAITLVNGEPVFDQQGQ